MKNIFKNLLFWIFLAITASTAVFLNLHWKGIQSANQRIAKITPLYEREITLAHLSLSLETYRRSAMNFRKMGNSEISEAKETLRNDFSEGLSQLDQLSPSQDDLAKSQSLRKEMGEFFELSAKFEPMLFLKDAYQKPEVVAVHEEMLDQISAMEESARTRVDKLNSVSTTSLDDSTRVLMGIAGGILFLVGVIFMRNYWVYLRPLQKLRKFAAAIPKFSEENEVDVPGGLSRAYREIATALKDTTWALLNLRRERQKFIEDIIQELKVPMAALKSGDATLLTGSLMDLRDLGNLNRLNGNLAEKTVDLSELLNDVTQKMSGAGLADRIQTSVPPLPIWIHLDAERFERVLIQLFSKMSELLPLDQNLIATAKIGTSPGFNGVEVSIGGPSSGVAPGPELDLTKHWISQTGFGMTLAHKVIRAHGGSISASGVKGSPVKFVIRLPRSRITDGLISPAFMNAADRKNRGLHFSDLNSF